MKALLQLANSWDLASLDHSAKAEKGPGSASQEGASPLLFSPDPGDAGLVRERVGSGLVNGGYLSAPPHPTPTPSAAALNGGKHASLPLANG